MGSEQQKIKHGKIRKYEGPSVTKAGRIQALEEAQREAAEEVAAEKETKENDVNEMLSTILGEQNDSASLDDLIRIVKGA